MKVTHVLRTLLLIPLLVVVSCGPQEEAATEEKMLPSQALEELTEQYQAQVAATASESEKTEAKVSIAQELLTQVRTDNLPRMEKFIYADLLLTAKRTDEGAEVMRELSMGEDQVARRAWNNVLMERHFEGEPEQFETLLKEYHSRLKPDPDHLQGISRPLELFISAETEAGDYQTAISVLENHIEWLNTQAPYEGWQLIATARPAYVATERLEEWQRLRDTAAADLRLAMDEEIHQPEIISKYEQLLQTLETAGQSEER